MSLVIKIFKFRYFNLVLHVLMWCIVLLFPYLVSSSGNQYKVGPLPGLYFTLTGIIHMIIFYGNALLLYPKFLNKRYWLLYIGLAVFFVILSIRLKFTILAWWFPDVLKDAGSRRFVFIPSVLVFVVSVFYSIVVDKTRTEKLQKEAKAMQLEMQLKFLRSQISPHFLFNILTSLVSLARKKSDHLEASLLMLSSLMRYMLYDIDKKICLQQEVEYLDSYIALQKLRFGNDVKVVCNIELPNKEVNYSIEPMLLIPFTENAFKHGTGYVDGPTINIKLTVNDGVLFFQVKNGYDRETDTSKDETSGIGLTNVRSRLTLLYPGRHNLVIHSEENIFSIDLMLKLL